MTQRQCDELCFHPLQLLLNNISPVPWDYLCICLALKSLAIVLFGYTAFPQWQEEPVNALGLLNPTLKGSLPTWHRGNRTFGGICVMTSCRFGLATPAYIGVKRISCLKGNQAWPPTLAVLALAFHCVNYYHRTCTIQPVSRSHPHIETHRVSHASWQPLNKAKYTRVTLNPRFAHHSLVSGDSYFL